MLFYKKNNCAITDGTAKTIQNLPREIWHMRKVKKYIILVAIILFIAFCFTKHGYHTFYDNKFDRTLYHNTSTIIYSNDRNYYDTYMTVKGYAGKDGLKITYTNMVEKTSIALAYEPGEDIDEQLEIGRVYKSFGRSYSIEITGDGSIVEITMAGRSKGFDEINKFLYTWVYAPIVGLFMPH